MIKHLKSIKTGTKVYVISGVNKGQKGVIKMMLPGRQRAIVSNCKTHSRRMKDPQGEKGSVINKPMPIHVSNLKLLKTSY